MAASVCAMFAHTQYRMQYRHFSHGAGARWFFRCFSQAKNVWECERHVNNKSLCGSSAAPGLVCQGSLGLTRPAVTPAGLSNVELLIYVGTPALVLLVLVVSVVICCHFRRKHAASLQRSCSGLPETAAFYQSPGGRVSFQRCSEALRSPHSEALRSPHSSSSSFLRTQRSDTDYQDYESRKLPPVTLSTFQNPQSSRLTLAAIANTSGSPAEQHLHCSESLVDSYRTCRDHECGATQGSASATGAAEAEDSGPAIVYYTSPYVVVQQQEAAEVWSNITSADLRRGSCLPDGVPQREALQDGV